MGLQPGLDPLVLVGGVVVHHHMQRPARVGLGDQLEEGQELAVAMPRLAGVGDAAGGHLQGREQRGGAVVQVVMGAPTLPGATGRTGWVRSSAWILGLLVHTQHDGVRRWVQVQPDHVADLVDALGIGRQLPALLQMRLEPKGPPDPRDDGRVPEVDDGLLFLFAAGRARVATDGGQGQTGEAIGPPFGCESVGAIGNDLLPARLEPM